MKITNKWCVLIMEVAFKTMPPYIWWQLHGAMWVSDAIQFCFHNFLVYLNKLENNSFHQLILYLFKTSEITVANILKISPIFSFYRIRLQYTRCTFAFSSKCISATLSLPSPSSTRDSIQIRVPAELSTFIHFAVFWQCHLSRDAVTTFQRASSDWAGWIGTEQLGAEWKNK